jgi:hypothetical protein
MSVYGLNKLLYRLENDAAFREQIKAEPEKTLGGFALTRGERRALTSGDVGKLFAMGVHPFLLNHLARHQLFGVNEENYLPRIRGQESPR